MSQPTYLTHQMHQIHDDIVYILQFEIPLRTEFSNLGHDLLLSCDLIDITSCMYLKLVHE